MANTLGQRTRVPADPPALCKKQAPNIRMWVLPCADFFGPNSWQWSDEAQRIRYALTRMEANDVATFPLTYWRQMTRELG